MDEQFGRGQWRPLNRFAVWESTKNKWRAIANGRCGVAVAQQRMRLQEPSATRKPIQRSTRDMKNAFRQIARADVHACVHIVAALHRVDKCLVCAELSGLAFGVGAAVNHFNRVLAHFVVVC